MSRPPNERYRTRITWENRHVGRSDSRRDGARFLTSYAAAESERAGLGIRFVSVLPQLTPATALGAAAVAGYAARQGVDVATFTEGMGPALTPGQVGQAITDLVTGPGPDHDACLLTAAGIGPLT